MKIEFPATRPFHQAVKSVFDSQNTPAALQYGSAHHSANHAVETGAITSPVQYGDTSTHPHPPFRNIPKN
jgi:hypothetical protein